MIGTRQEATAALFKRINERIAEIPTTQEKYQDHPRHLTTQTYLSREELINIFKTVLERNDLFRMFEENEMIKVIRLSKDDPKNPNLKRTVHIVLQADNSLALMVENKSKLATGVKSKAEWVRGGQKYGKPSLRIDKEEAIQYYSMMQVLKDEDDDYNETAENIDAHFREYKIQEIFNKHIPFNLNITSTIPHSHSIFKIEYQEESESKTILMPEKITYHSERAIGDLHKFLSKENSLTPFEKEQIKIDILAGLETLHDKKIIHQDIKPGNILIYQVNGIKRAKISDFGLCVIGDDETQNKHPTCTRGYESPEIIAYRYTHHSKQIKGAESLGLQIFNHEYRNLYESGEFPIPDQYLKPNTANDIWAAGLVFFYIDSDGSTHQDPSDPRLQTPLLNSMLKRQASQRISAEDAHFQMLSQRDYSNPHCYIQLLDTLIIHYIDLIEYESLLCSKTIEGRTKKNNLDNLLLILRQIKENIPNHQDEKTILANLGNLSAMAIQVIERYEYLSRMTPSHKSSFSFKSIFSFRNTVKKQDTEKTSITEYEKKPNQLFSLLKDNLLHHNLHFNQTTNKATSSLYHFKR